LTTEGVGETSGFADALGAFKGWIDHRSFDFEANFSPAFFCITA
jgi:hypothetical protein